MSTGTPNESVHPYELGGREAELRVRIPIANFERLKALLLTDEGDLVTTLHFTLDDHGRCIVTGEVAGPVRLHCQGCALDMAHELRGELRTVLVRTDDEAKALMPASDVLVVEHDSLSLVELLEDELILDLPEVVCGRFESCPHRPRLQYGAAEDVAKSPFSALAKLLGQPTDDRDPQGRG